MVWLSPKQTFKYSERICIKGMLKGESPEFYIQRLASYLRLSNSFYNECLFVLNEMHKRDETLYCRNPRVLAGTIVYLLSMISKERRTAKQISENLGVTTNPIYHASMEYRKEVVICAKIFTDKKGGIFRHL